MPRSDTQTTTWSIDALFAPWTRAFAVAIMLASIVFPVNGLGFDICMLHRETGLPCPGCGMSRGLAAITHGDFARAAVLQPFAFLFWLLLAGIAVTAVMPAAVRHRVKKSLDRPFVVAMYKYSILAFITFGIGRLVVFLVMGWRFP